MHASLGCGALSAKCAAGPNTPDIFSSGLTLDSAVKAPFLKPLFLAPVLEVNSRKGLQAIFMKSKQPQSAGEGRDTTMHLLIGHGQDLEP